LCKEKKLLITSWTMGRMPFDEFSRVARLLQKYGHC
jgi:hypothetical protein